MSNNFGYTATIEKYNTKIQVERNKYNTEIEILMMDLKFYQIALNLSRQPNELLDKAFNLIDKRCNMRKGLLRALKLSWKK